MPETADITLINGAQELMTRTGHLFTRAENVACAANDLHTFATTSAGPELWRSVRRHRADNTCIRKMFRPAALLEPSSAQHLHALRDAGAQVRITTQEINETILFDGKLAILAGNIVDGARSYSVITRTETVQGVTSLFEAAWRNATELATYDARVAEIRTLAPRILDLLSSGCQDETAARTLDLGLRTYRRRVAELLSALDATSRFQAGAKAQHLGLL